MKILIVGAGGQGGPCASILAKDPEVERIKLMDLDKAIADRVADKIKSPKIETGRLDATDEKAVADAAAGMDVVIDLVMPWMAAHVMKGALAAGANYVNSAFDTPFWEELVAGEPLSLNEEFEKAGLTALLGSGMAPGFINVLARQQCDKLDEVDSIKLRIAKAKTGGGKYDDITAPWNPGWAPAQALKDCSDPAVCFEDGKYGYVPPYDGIEEWQFAEPIGKKLVSHHSHEEPYSLPKNIGKGLQYCDFKYYVSYHPAALVSLGLTSQEKIKVKDVEVAPLDVVTAVIPKAGNAFLNENPQNFAYNDEHSFMSMMAEVKGRKGGTEKTYLVNCPQMTTPAKAICDLFGTSLVNVALPVICGAKQICEGALKGVIFAEQLDPKRFLTIMKSTGYPYEWTVIEK